MRDKFLEQQQEHKLEGLAIGLEQRGEKSAAHEVRGALAEIQRLRAMCEELTYERNELLARSLDASH